MMQEEETYMKQLELQLIYCKELLANTAAFSLQYAETSATCASDNPLLQADVEAFLTIHDGIAGLLAVLNGDPAPPKLGQDFHDDKPDNATPDWQDNPNNDQVLGYKPANGGA